MFGQITKLAVAAILAILLASFLFGISYYVIPDQEIPLSSPSQSLFNVYSSVALSRIYVDDNGTVYPTHAPIVRIGDVYSFTGDVINYTLEIQKDNIIIDGVGRSCKGYVEGSTIFGDQGIYLNGRINVTIKNINIEQFWKGIVVQNSSSIIINGNNMSNLGSTAIDVESSSYATIVGNNISTLGEAIKIDNTYDYDQSLNNTVSENTITNSRSGIQIHSGLLNSITKNTFVNVDNPIWVASNLTIISKNIMINGIDGIGIGGKYSDASGNYSGGSFCTISGNKIDNFTQSGLYFNIGINNTIYENTIANSKYGVAINLGGDIDGSWIMENNTLYHNNFINNVQDVFIGAPSYINYWDNGKEGNYWSKFNGADNNKDGISDTPYSIYANNTDRYPLMNPCGNPEIQQTLSSQMLAMYLGIGLAISIVIMVGTAFYMKKRTKND